MINRRFFKVLMVMSAMASMTSLALPASANNAAKQAPPKTSENWENIQESLFDGRFMLSGEGVVKSNIPYRVKNDLRSMLGAEISVPKDTSIKKVWFIIDENPMPISLQITPKIALKKLNFEGSFRINRQTHIHVVVETADGRLFREEKYAKTSGVGACAAPPGTDMKEALKTMGKMQLTTDNSPRKTGLGGGMTDLAIDISHPSNSGLQMDQITLLYIPALYVYQMQLKADQTPWLDVEGSISLSENPQLRFSLPENAHTVSVSLTDSDDHQTDAKLELKY